MSKFHNKQYFKEIRRVLRDHSTDAEDLLWQSIRNRKLGFKFRRQHSIGNFIVDFYCPEKRLIIEIDGEIHLTTKDNDTSRDEYFRNLNYKVIRFLNQEIEDSIETVLLKIRNIMVV